MVYFLRRMTYQILLVQKSDKSKEFKGQWNIAGGRIKSRTGLVENLKREPKELNSLDEYLREVPKNYLIKMGFIKLCLMKA
jgi:hypothetical protein